MKLRLQGVQYVCELRQPLSFLLIFYTDRTSLNLTSKLYHTILLLVKGQGEKANCPQIFVRAGGMFFKVLFSSKIIRIPAPLVNVVKRRGGTGQDHEIF